jgi:hypothetical protein
VLVNKVWSISGSIEEVNLIYFHFMGFVRTNSPSYGKYLLLHKLSNYILITYLLLEVLTDMTVAYCVEALLDKQVHPSGNALDMYSRYTRL